jgi:hypothetical protein
MIHTIIFNPVRWTARRVRSPTIPFVPGRATAIRGRSSRCDHSLIFLPDCPISMTLFGRCGPANDPSRLVPGHWWFRIRSFHAIQLPPHIISHDNMCPRSVKRSDIGAGDAVPRRGRHARSDASAGFGPAAAPQTERGVFVTAVGDGSAEDAPWPPRER